MCFWQYSRYLLKTSALVFCFTILSNSSTNSCLIPGCTSYLTVLTHKRSAKGSGQSSIKIILRGSLSFRSLNISSSGSSYFSELKNSLFTNLQVALIAELLEPLEFLGVSAEVVLYKPKELLGTLHKWLIHE